ncbi:MAG: amidohydrolase family protein [Bacteroidota bacterium]
MRRLSLLLLVLSISVPAVAQRAVTEDTPLRPVTRTFALSNARVVQAPGQVLDNATVVIRDGLIEAVGSNVTIPFDAEVIEADSLTVYAGFIDGLGYAGVAKPEAERPDIDNPDEPPRAVAGLTPDRDVRALLKVNDNRITQLRELGFAAAHVAPRDGFLAGRTALVLLAGDTPEAMVLRGDVAQLAQFDTAPGAYPATPMAIIARIREVMQQASDLGEAAASYAEEPAGRGRVAYDPVLDALAPTVRGDQPVLFVVDDSNEAFRALKLSQDTGANVLLAGLTDPMALADRMAEEDRPLLLSLDLPDALEAEDADSTASESHQAATRTFSYESLDAETATLQSKRRAAMELVESGARLLDSLDVAFAFALLDMKPGEVQSNLRRLIDAGLPEDAALAALTTTAAEMFDVDAMVGTVEAGKMANLVVTNGSYFDAETTVQMVFVDGHKFELASEAPPEGADPDAVVEAMGTWDYTADVSGQTTSGTFTLEGEADNLTGSITTDQLGTVTLDSVSLEGNVLTMVFSAEGMGRITGSGLIEGDTFTGTLELAGGDFTIPIEATRRPE